MATNNYYKKHSNTFATDFTADMSPAYIGNPENDNHIPHGRH